MTKVYYTVKWKGYPSSQNTEEPRASLIEDVPDIVNEFEKKYNKETTKNLMKKYKK